MGALQWLKQAQRRSLHHTTPSWLHRSFPHQAGHQGHWGFQGNAFPELPAGNVCLLRTPELNWLESHKGPLCPTSSQARWEMVLLFPLPPLSWTAECAGPQGRGMIHPSERLVTGT